MPAESVADAMDLISDLDDVIIGQKYADVSSDMEEYGVYHVDAATTSQLAFDNDDSNYYNTDVMLVVEFDVTPIDNDIRFDAWRVAWTNE